MRCRKQITASGYYEREAMILQGPFGPWIYGGRSRERKPPPFSGGWQMRICPGPGFSLKCPDIPPLGRNLRNYLDLESQGLAGGSFLQKFPRGRPLVVSPWTATSLDQVTRENGPSFFQGSLKDVQGQTTRPTKARRKMELEQPRGGPWKLQQEEICPG